MLIRVLEGNVGTDGAAAGNEVWSGGYGVAGDDDRLPAAILASAIPNFEVGRWYALAEFEELLEQQGDDKVSSTTVDVPQMGVQGSWSATLEIGQGQAAQLVCLSVVEHVRRLSTGSEIWIRVE